MEYRERIQSKVGILFQIAEQYLSGQIPQEQAKEQIGSEMTRIRPAQLEAVKAELAERLQASDSQLQSEKLFELFRNYLSPPFHKLQNGHPLRNYWEENSRVRTCLVKMDQMEGEQAAVSDWAEVYEFLSRFRIHIKRQKQNFHPLLISLDMGAQIEKITVLGSAILDEIDKNHERLKKNAIVDFLFYQRNLIQMLMEYLDLEEKVLYPKVLVALTDQDFTSLRNKDDQAGYAYIEKPDRFIPEKNEIVAKIRPDSDVILKALLPAKEMGIVYYSLSGEVTFLMGNVNEHDLQIPEEIKQKLLRGSLKKKKYKLLKGDQTYLVTYSQVTDHSGKTQGFLKSIENISELGESAEEFIELRTEKESVSGTAQKRAERSIDETQNIAELFGMYPKFKEDFFHLHEELEGLRGPYGMSLLKDSSIDMIARSLRIDAADLLKRIDDILDSYER